jgi:hypothetical protein
LVRYGARTDTAVVAIVWGSMQHLRSASGKDQKASGMFGTNYGMIAYLCPFAPQGLDTRQRPGIPEAQEAKLRLVVQMTRRVWPQSSVQGIAYSLVL